MGCADAWEIWRRCSEGPRAVAKPGNSRSFILTGFGAPPPGFPSRLAGGEGLKRIQPGRFSFLSTARRSPAPLARALSAQFFLPSFLAAAAWFPSRPRRALASRPETQYPRRFLARGPQSRRLGLGRTTRAALPDVQYRESLVQSPVVVFESFGSGFRVLLVCCARFCFPGVARSDLEWCSPPSDCLALCVRFPLLKPEPRRPGERERDSASSPPPLPRILALRAASPPAAPTAAILSLSLRLRTADHAGKSRRNFSSFPRRPSWWQCEPSPSYPRSSILCFCFRVCWWMV